MKSEDWEDKECQMGWGDCLEHSEESTFTGLMVGLVTDSGEIMSFIYLFTHIKPHY